MTQGRPQDLDSDLVRLWRSYLDILNHHIFGCLPCYRCLGGRVSNLDTRSELQITAGPQKRFEAFRARRLCLTLQVIVLPSVEDILSRARSTSLWRMAAHSKKHGLERPGPGIRSPETRARETRRWRQFQHPAADCRAPNYRRAGIDCPIWQIFPCLLITRLSCTCPEGHRPSSVEELHSHANEHDHDCSPGWVPVHDCLQQVAIYPSQSGLLPVHMHSNSASRVCKNEVDDKCVCGAVRSNHLRLERNLPRGAAERMDQPDRTYLAWRTNSHKGSVMGLHIIGAVIFDL